MSCIRYLVPLLALATIVTDVRAVERRPNVILVMADDLGYECIGANGGTSYRTPVLDRLAATGVRCTHCYVQPLCTPTRIQLMTGQYNVRNYREFGEMDARLKTFGNFFRDAGYATCIVGKWQLGRDVSLPKTFGFDEACLWQHTRRPGRYRNPGLEINGKEVDYTKGEYGPDLVNDYALDFIGRHRDKPFFLYYPMMLTHGPYDPTPDSPGYGGRGQTRKQRKGEEGINPNFADMVAYMDKLLGKLVAHLDQLGIRENTLLLFVGDNGTGKGTRSMMGSKVVIGNKGEPNAGGMHVPLIASWPGKIAAGKVCHDLVDSTDFLPTICASAGVAVPSGWTLDGRSFLPQLRGEKGNPRDWYYCWYAPRNGILRAEFAATARYKLYRSGQFYDLDRDPDEKRSLPVAALEGEAAVAAKLLQGALDRYKDARPAHLGAPAGKPQRRAKGPEAE
jgi:arylsulfatase A